MTADDVELFSVGYLRNEVGSGMPDMQNNVEYDFKLQKLRLKLTLNFIYQHIVFKLTFITFRYMSANWGSDDASGINWPYL